MLLNRYVSEIKELLQADLSDRFIIDQINQFRAVWIKNELNKNRVIDDVIKQTITCIEMTIQTQSECPAVTTTDMVLKSTVSIPKTIIRSNRDSILSVRNSKILSERYNYVPLERAVYSGSGKVNKREIFAFIYNDYLYIKLNPENPKIPLLNKVSIEGLFENPLDVAEMTCCDDSTCYDITTMDYPLSIGAWAYIKSQMIPDGK